MVDEADALDPGSGQPIYRLKVVDVTNANGPPTLSFSTNTARSRKRHPIWCRCPIARFSPRLELLSLLPLPSPFSPTPTH